MTLIVIDPSQQQFPYLRSQSCWRRWRCQDSIRKWSWSSFPVPSRRTLPCPGQWRESGDPDSNQTWWSCRTLLPDSLSWRIREFRYSRCKTNSVQRPLYLVYAERKLFNDYNELLMIRTNFTGSIGFVLTRFDKNLYWYFAFLFCKTDKRSAVYFC